MSICPLLSMITMRQTSKPVNCFGNQCQWWDKCNSSKTPNIEPPFGLWEANTRLRGDEDE